MKVQSVFKKSSCRMQVAAKGFAEGDLSKNCNLRSCYWKDATKLHTWGKMRSSDRRLDKVSATPVTKCTGHVTAMRFCALRCLSRVI